MVLVNLAVDAVRLDAGDMGVVHVAYALRHKLHSLILYGVALSVGSNLLHLARVFAQFLVMLLVGRTSALLITRQQTVNHRVRIAADRRCEVRVIVERQTEVTRVVDGVFSLHHRTQRHRLNEVLLTLALTCVHKSVQRTCHRTLRAVRLHLISELHHKLAQRL